MSHPGISTNKRLSPGKARAKSSLQEEEAAMQVFSHAKTPALQLLPLEKSG
jgi:hypothetical protein